MQGFAISSIERQSPEAISGPAEPFAEKIDHDELLDEWFYYSEIDDDVVSVRFGPLDALMRKTSGACG